LNLQKMKNSRFVAESYMVKPLKSPK